MLLVCLISLLSAWYLVVVDFYPYHSGFLHRLWSTDSIANTHLFCIKPSELSHFEMWPWTSSFTISRCGHICARWRRTCESWGRSDWAALHISGRQGRLLWQHVQFHRGGASGSGCRRSRGHHTTWDQVSQEFVWNLKHFTDNLIICLEYYCRIRNQLRGFRSCI